MATRFVPSRIVSTIHSDLLQRYGGRPGLRDPGLLDSALAQPKMTVGGEFVHKTLFDKAAAYGFHVCKNHPFVDGNKRAGITAVGLSLVRNGWRLTASNVELEAFAQSVAWGEVSVAEMAAWLRQHSRQEP